MATQVKRDSPSLAFRYTVFATMFSNSINSSLIGFARPNRVGEEEASWSTATLAGDVDRGEHVRLLSHRVNGTCIRQTPICVPADAAGVHDRSPFTEDQRARALYLLDVSRHGTANLNAASDGSPFDRSVGWIHLKSIRRPGENASNASVIP